MLASKFSRKATAYRQSTPIENGLLERIAPSIFANDRHASRSDRYTYVPTIDVIEGLRKEGFFPFFAAQGGSRIAGKAEFTKHIIRLRHASQINDAEANEIVLINSHDGTSSYQMLGGVLRFVCQNGLVIGDSIAQVRIPHKGDIAGQVIEGAYEILNNFDRIDHSVELMKSITLNNEEQNAFASAVNVARLELLPSAPHVEDYQILKPRRRADAANDLWSTFNVAQENVIRGGMRGLNANNQRTTTREVKSIDSNIKINKALWQLAEKMKEIKLAA